MSYNFTFSNSLATTSVATTVSTNHDFTATAQASDYVSTNTILVAANSEVVIQLPGTNQLQAVMITSTNDFDVALAEDGGSAPIYTGLFGNVYSRVFTNGTLYNLVSIKASTDDVLAEVSIAGLSTT